MRPNYKKTDRLRVKGEAKAKFQPKDYEPKEDMHNDPIPDDEVKNNERDEKVKRRSKNESISE